MVLQGLHRVQATHRDSDNKTLARVDVLYALLIFCRVNALVRFVGEGLYESRFGVEEIVGRTYDIRAVLARCLETTANL